MTILEMLDAYRAQPAPAPSGESPAVDSPADVIDALGDGSEQLTYRDGTLTVTVSAARYAELLEQSRWGAR